MVNVFILNELPGKDGSAGTITEFCLGGVQFPLDQFLNPVHERKVVPVSLVLPVRSVEEITTDKVGCSSV